MHPLSLLTLSLLPSLFTCAITASAAVALAPSLLDNAAQLEDALAAYKEAQIQIAAAKLKSILHYEGSEAVGRAASELKSGLKKAGAGSDSDSESSANDSDNSDDDSSDVDDVPTAATLLLAPFNNLLKQLDAPAATLIKSASLTSQSLEDFVAAKEHEATQKLQESLAAIREIQRVLNSHPSSPASQAISAKLLARLIAKMDALHDEYEEISTLEKRLKSSKEEKRNKARKELVNSQVKIQKIVQRLAEIVSE